VGKRTPCSLLDLDPVSQMVFLSDKEPLVVLKGNRTRKGAMETAVKSGRGDDPFLSD